jgi:HSP20 family molecular chaperone IbpA
MTSPVKIDRTSDYWRIDLPVPGVDPSHIKISVANQVITFNVSDPAATESGSPRHLEIQGLGSSPQRQLTVGWRAAGARKSPLSCPDFRAGSFQ